MTDYLHVPPDPEEAIEVRLAATKSPVCACLGRLRVFMRPLNGKPGTDYRTGAAFIYINRLDRSGPNPPYVAASFCPVCGEAYQ